MTIQPHTIIEIINIRSDRHESNGRDMIRKQIATGLSKPTGQKSLPDLLLYDERGLRLYDDLTTKAAEYYLFAAEEEILINHANEIARSMHAAVDGDVKAGELVVELGSGALRKTSHILSGLADLIPGGPPTSAPITYYALDLEERELMRTLKELNVSDIGEQIRGKISTRGLCATYDDGLRLIREGGLRSVGAGSQAASRAGGGGKRPPGADHPPLHILFLGSSLGNFRRGDDAAFLRSFPLRPGSGDTLLLALDHENDPKDIEMAYNDPHGMNEAFIMNGLLSAGKAVGDEGLFVKGKWAYFSKYNKEERREEASYKSLENQAIVDPVSNATYQFKVGELIRIEESHKYSDRESNRLFAEAQLRPIHRWTDSSGRYSLWLLERLASSSK